MYFSMTGKKRDYIFTCFSCILLLILHGCENKTEKVMTIEEKDTVKIAIVKYNVALIKAYRHVNIKALNGIASSRQISKVNAIIYGMYGDGIYMESDLVDIEYVEFIKKDEESLDVRTREEWRWRHVDIKTREEVKPWVKVEQKITYHMIRDNKKRWIVDSLEVMK